MKKIITYTLISTLINSFSFITPSFAYNSELKNQETIRLDLKEKNPFESYNQNKNFKTTKVKVDCDSANGRLWGTGIGIGAGFVFGSIASADSRGGGFIPLQVIFAPLFGALGLLIGFIVDEKNNFDCKNDSTAVRS